MMTRPMTTSTAITSTASGVGVVEHDEHDEADPDDQDPQRVPVVARRMSQPVSPSRRAGLATAAHALADSRGQVTGTRKPRADGDDDRDDERGAQRRAEEREHLVVDRARRVLVDGRRQRVEIDRAAEVEEREQQRHRERDPERGAEDRAPTIPRQPYRDHQQDASTTNGR